MKAPCRVHLVILLLSFWLITAASSAPVEMMLPEVYAEGRDVTGWLISEKLDGVRGYWDGERLWSKNGKVFNPPAAFIRDLPDFALEGELWGGRGTFEKTISIVLKDEAHDGWLQLKFGIFDVPEASGGFMRRLEKAREWFAEHPSPYAFLISQNPVRQQEHLQQELQRVEELGGEGLIVRKPDALYAGGRSSEILKVKDFQDAEAVVVAHLPGQGRNIGRLGALLVELPDGIRFKVGSGFSDEERENPPAIGELITFRYFGYYLSGIPRFPSFLRIRLDKDL
ncbi:DNA ligase [Desulfopila inferna]|uniref:DNA ligase n=1 Tax=Desulfopila inferna TaxID=468528 RepID=UPI001962F028|nr:DNA ligase [Desulfopila inferna]MBM9604379.1 DNA ligase [Desulfopila inferna]